MLPRSPVTSLGHNCGGSLMIRPCRSHAFKSGQVADMVHESVILVGWDFIQVPVSNFKHTTIEAWKSSLVAVQLLYLSSF